MFRSVTFARRGLTAVSQSSFQSKFTRIPQAFTMSGFSNTDTGSKTADPYTAKNKDEVSLKEKVEDLFTFIDKTKFCLFTTHAGDSDLLASRAMALAAKVRHT
jgi:hypothetical protein